MKPFDLEAAKAGKPIVTRDGRKARLLAHVPEARQGYRVVAFIAGDDSAGAFYEDGTYIQSEECRSDLFMDGESRTVYVNVFPGGHADWFDTEAEARAGLNARALKVAVPVKWEV
jgi:hypothetical protein